MWLRWALLGPILYSAYLLPRLPVALAWDQAAVAALAAGRKPGWTAFFHFVSDVSDTRGFLVALLLPMLLFFFFKKRWATGLSFLLGVGLLKLSISGLKWFFGRSRPTGGLESHATLSMPSGHAANAVIMFGLFVIFLWPHMKTMAGRTALVVIGLLGIFLVDLSRVYLGVHYPSDVIVGSLYTATGLWILQGMRRDVFTL